MAKRYDKEFKLHAVKQVVEAGKTAAQVARELDIANQTLCTWVQKYKENQNEPFVGSGNLRSDDKALKDLEKQIRDLQEKKCNLKKGYGHLCKRPEVIYRFIKKHQHLYRVAKMCQVLGVSKSGYYIWLKRPTSMQKQKKDKLTAKIKRIHVQSRGIYGRPKITKVLAIEGVNVPQKTVANIMKENNIKSKTVKKYKAITNSNHSLPLSPNLLKQNFTVDAPGKVWVTDITYVWTGQGWLYLATVMDIFSRKIIGWTMDGRMTKDLVILALRRAIWRQAPKQGLIHHSDCGTQYCSKAYRALLDEYGIITDLIRR